MNRRKFLAAMGAIVAGPAAVAKLALRGPSQPAAPPVEVVKTHTKRRSRIVMGNDPYQGIEFAETGPWEPVKFEHGFMINEDLL